MQRIFCFLISKQKILDLTDNLYNLKLILMNYIFLVLINSLNQISFIDPILKISMHGSFFTTFLMKIPFR